MQLYDWFVMINVQINKCGSYIDSDAITTITYSHLSTRVVFAFWDRNVWGLLHDPTLN
jgi:hypothetical protein